VAARKEEGMLELLMIMAMLVEEEGEVEVGQVVGVEEAQGSQKRLTVMLKMRKRLMEMICPRYKRDVRMTTKQRLATIIERIGQLKRQQVV
jgi:hypothetical protein